MRVVPTSSSSPGPSAMVRTAPKRSGISASCRRLRAGLQLSTLLSFPPPLSTVPSRRRHRAKTLPSCARVCCPIWYVSLPPFPTPLPSPARVQVRMFPSESPVSTSPAASKTKHWMNFGFLYFPKIPCFLVSVAPLHVQK